MQRENSASFVVVNKVCMASRRKAKSSRQSPRNDLTEEGFVPEVDFHGDFVQKDAYLALKRAFEGLKGKVKYCEHEINTQFKNNKHLESKLELFARENEALKEKVALSFKAYDEKYREIENLKKELKAATEEKSKHSEDREQQDLVVQKEETATQTKASLDSARDENETVDNYTQTLEEKTDEVGCVPPTTPTKLLKNCGLEILLQNGNYFLLLYDRDLLKKWIENETDGKVIVVFEKTPVFERFVQTDEIIREQIQCGECPENRAIIIQLKNKIVDQANLIKRYREQQTSMSESKKLLSLSVEVQTEGKVFDEYFMKKQVQLVQNYKNKVSKSMHLLMQKLIQLYKELDYQNKFGNRLLAIISSTMDVPENFVSTVVTAVQSKSDNIKKGKKSPIPRAYQEDKSLEFSKDVSPEESFAASSEPFLSLPVQETDRRLRFKISKPRDPDYDSTNDEEGPSGALAESRSLTSESSASIVPAEEVPQHTLVVDNITTSATRGVLPTPLIDGTGSSRSARIEQTSGNDDGDDIVVIEENEAGAAGEVSGAKECPICYILYTPATSQSDYEKHVMGHFQDFD